MVIYIVSETSGAIWMVIYTLSETSGGIWMLIYTVSETSGAIVALLRCFRHVSARPGAISAVSVSPSLVGTVFTLFSKRSWGFLGVIWGSPGGLLGLPKYSQLGTPRSSQICSE